MPRPARITTARLESAIYVVSGRARMRWGDHLEYVAEAGPGDFIFVPPYVPHQEINANTDEPLACVLVRSDQEAVVVNLELEPVEKPETVRWIHRFHPAQLSTCYVLRVAWRNVHVTRNT